MIYLICCFVYLVGVFANEIFLRYQDKYHNLKLWIDRDFYYLCDLFWPIFIVIYFSLFFYFSAKYSMIKLINKIADYFIKVD